MMYVLWVAAEPPARPRGPVDWPGVAAFLGGFAALVLIPAAAVRLTLRRSADPAAWSIQRRYGRLWTISRLAIVGWLWVGLFLTNCWTDMVASVLSPLGHLPLSLPGMILGPLPALCAWVGLLWAQHPLERLAREQSIGPLLEYDLPVHPAPSAASIIGTGLRLQVLATAIPLLLIALVRDSVNVSLWAATSINTRNEWVEFATSLGSALVVLAIAPEPLRRILRTTRLPSLDLRERLDRLCKLARTRYREVLLWKTDYAMGNAAVMGVFPQIRYVLLSDLLLETMTDREIEAVFAHELGHIVHRHTLWYVVFLLLSMLMLVAAGTVTDQLIIWSGATAAVQNAAAIGAMLLFFTVAIGLFGVFSRCLERQADVYAARAMQQIVREVPAVDDPRRMPVGEAGADLITSALYRAAFINRIPIHARSFRHGSIARRVAFVQRLAEQPTMTFRFDRSMRVLFASLLCLSAAGGAAAAWIAMT